MGYKPGEARIDKVLTDHKVRSGKELFERLRADEWLPADWPKWFPKHDLEKTVRLACQFLAQDCRSNQKALGVSAYNKIKHALMVVPSGKVYLPSHPDIPSVLFYNPGSAVTGSSDPIVLYGFPIDDAKLDERERLVHFVGRSLRLMAALYLLARYPGVVTQAWGGTGHAMFLSWDLQDIVELIQEVTAKK